MTRPCVLACVREREKDGEKTQKPDCQQARSACFFSLTQASQPCCDPTQLSDWSLDCEFEGKEARWRVGARGLPGATHPNNMQLIKHTHTLWNTALKPRRRLQPAHNKWKIEYFYRPTREFILLSFRSLIPVWKFISPK